MTLHDSVDLCDTQKNFTGFEATFLPVPPIGPDASLLPYVEDEASAYRDYRNMFLTQWSWKNMTLYSFNGRFTDRESARCHRPVNGQLPTYRVF